MSKKCSKDELDYLAFVREEEDYTNELGAITLCDLLTSIDQKAVNPRRELCHAMAALSSDYLG
jgi:hypothetical protein